MSSEGSPEGTLPSGNNCHILLSGIELCADAYLVNSNVVRSMRRGGNESNGRNAGVSAVNANNAPSNGNSNYGGGLDPGPRRASYAKASRCACSHVLSDHITGTAKSAVQKWIEITRVEAA